jgi:hypothetical protein
MGLAFSTPVALKGVALTFQGGYIWRRILRAVERRLDTDLEAAGFQIDELPDH